MSTAVQVLEMKDKVTRWMTGKGLSPQVDRDGDLSVRNGSSRVFVRVLPWREDSTVVRIFSPLLAVEPSPALYRHVALHADDYVMGGLRVTRGEETVAVELGHSLLGDYLDPEEFFVALALMARVADELDTSLQKQFGGRVLYPEGDDRDE